jgi:hypothetical protein
VKPDRCRCGERLGISHRKQWYCLLGCDMLLLGTLRFDPARQSQWKTNSHVGLKSE